MNIEDIIFKKSIIDVNKLIKYGFSKSNNKYVYKTIIKDTNLELNVIYDNKINIYVYDLDFDIEYTNHRIETLNGSFNTYVKEFIQNVLEDIRDKCTSNTYFVSNQANRICDALINKYGSVPEFLWDDTPDCGVFKKQSGKWYGIIMNVSYNKFNIDNNLKTDVINIKIDETKLDDYLNIKGIYHAYHMNKKKWISILLDDTLLDSDIIDLIDLSYSLVK